MNIRGKTAGRGRRGEHRFRCSVGDGPGMVYIRCKGGRVELDIRELAGVTARCLGVVLDTKQALQLSGALLTAADKAKEPSPASG